MDSMMFVAITADVKTQNGPVYRGEIRRFSVMEGQRIVAHGWGVQCEPGPIPPSTSKPDSSSERPLVVDDVAVGLEEEGVDA